MHLRAFDPCRLLLLALLALGACEGDSIPGAAPGGEEDEASAPALALYGREVLFLPRGGEGGSLALAAQVRPDDDRALRGTHAWLRRGDEWSALLQDQWEAAPLRQPWRILPHGSLRVLVEDGGELESLIFGRGADAPRLNPGSLAGEWTSGPMARVLLRQGELLSGGSTSAGLVLDVELGAGALPSERMGTLLFLVDSADAAVAAVRLPEGELRLLTLTLADSGPDEGAPVRLESDAAGWRLVEADGGEVLAELQAEGGGAELEAGAEPDTVGDPHALPTRPPIAVRGWVADERGRRSVRGLLLGATP